MHVASSRGSRMAGRSSRMWIERFPVTMIFGVQLLAMVIIPTIVKSTEPFALILTICSVALFVAFYTELLMQSRALSSKPAKRVTIRAAWTVLIVGGVAVVVSTVGGRGSYAVQVGLAEESPIVGLTAPFTTWTLFGVAMLLWLYKKGDVKRRTALWVVFGVLALFLWEGLMRAILGQSAALMLTVVILAVLVKLIRLRIIVLTLLLIPLLWPPIYDFRDSLRRDTAGMSAMVSANAPLERLQLDAQMSQIAPLSQVADLRALDLLTLARIGLIPGFLDSPDRPRLDTGSQISVALGGMPTNSRSATMLGNLYVFEGWFGIVVFMLALTIAMGIALGRDNPWALAFAGLIYWYGMSFNASYPEVVPKVLQASISMLIAYLVVRRLSATADRPRASGTRTGSRRR